MHGLRVIIFALGLQFLMPVICHAILIKGKVEVAKGRVYIHRQGRILQAVDDMNIYTGDVVETSEHGALLIEMMDVGLLKMKSGTQIRFPSEDDQQIQVSRMDLSFGEIWMKIRKMELGEVFELNTPNTVSLVSNAICSAGFDKRRKKTIVNSIEGEIELHRNQTHFFLSAGERIILDSRTNSQPRQTKFDIFKENQTWKQIITIREKLDRKLKESVKAPAVAGEGEADFEAPIVHIVSPLEGTPMKKREVEVIATIHEDHLERVIFTHNDKVIRDVATGLKNFREKLVLTPGNNEIEIKAMDRYGNSGLDRKVIQLGDLPPSVAILSPLDNLELSSRFVDLQGVVDDPDVREVQVFLNGRRIAKDRAVPTFFIPLILDVGENVIRVEAINGAGLKGFREVTCYTTTKSNVIIQLNGMLN